VKIDLYGRYVAHVFYQPGESDKRLVALQGRYLNQELVNRGMAKVL
jgi:endonuclease YncB( thermonuclease family)